jgi:hypothetical protein
VTWITPSPISQQTAPPISPPEVFILQETF